MDLSIIQDCIADGTIFESVKYHNAVFVGKDRKRNAQVCRLPRHD
ncbi:MAG: hypothetical protein ACLUTU_09445 [Blautia faecis]